MITSHLDICSNNHDEVCFVGRCPVCPLLIQIADLETAKDELSATVHDVNKRLDSYEDDFVKWVKIKDNLLGPYEAEGR